MKSIACAAVLVLAALPVLAKDSGHPAPAVGVPAREALGMLKSGNERFTGGKAEHRKQEEDRRRELSTGQKPHTIILSCSDSRVPPELIFDQGLGELFTVRVAGNILGAATVASIEYAVEHLGSRLIVVMGHESCGAVKAALEIPGTQTAGSVDLDSLLASIRPNLEGFKRAPASGDKTLREPVKANVNGVVAQLIKRSKVVRKAVEGGLVKVVPGIYGLASGKVEFWGEPAAD